MRTCRRCPLAEKAHRFVAGKGPRPCDIMVVGEGPGQDEDWVGEPFIGRSGTRLEVLLRRAGLTRDGVFLTNIVKHRPPNNRNPQVAEVLACEKFLFHELLTVKPKIIIALGAVAGRWFDATTVLEKDNGFPKEVVITRSMRQLYTGERDKKLTNRAAATALGVRPRDITAGVVRAEWLPTLKHRYESLVHTPTVSWKGTVIPMYHPAASLYDPSVYPQLIEGFVKLWERLAEGPPSAHYYRLVTNEEAMEYVA